MIKRSLMFSGKLQHFIPVVGSMEKHMPPSARLFEWRSNLYESMFNNLDLVIRVELKNQLKNE